uniref:Uncharacterized protein n=1 Tax=Arundo donax TaxID=35708 RepID=A0A0A9BB95_ARUDO
MTWLSSSIQTKIRM